MIHFIDKFPSVKKKPNYTEILYLKILKILCKDKEFNSKLKVKKPEIWSRPYHCLNQEFDWIIKEIQYNEEYNCMNFQTEHDSCTWTINIFDYYDFYYDFTSKDLIKLFNNNKIEITKTILKIFCNINYKKPFYSENELLYKEILSYFKK